MSDEKLIVVTGPHDGVAVITLNRPQRRNALTYEMGEQFGRVVGEVSANKEVRAVVITGAGSSFCAGADFSLLQGWKGATLQEAQEMMTRFYKLFLRVKDLEVPSIAAITGGAIGAGCCLALACDLRVAALDAKLALNFVRLGIPPGMGGTFHLPAIVGPAVAMDLIFTGRVVDGREALGLGLVCRVMPQEDVLYEATKLAEAIAANSSFAVRRSKRAIQLAMAGCELDESLKFEAHSQATCFNTDDYAAAMRGVTRHRA
ncbi:MAG: enoyl-CoA hydratase/isomerase family protein [Proteobacteria bacterium]|nr:enoyl-CoA hydratase/isomerase family protein [Pseudomonadota bacterium]